MKPFVFSLKRTMFQTYKPRKYRQLYIQDYDKNKDRKSV